MIERPFEYLKRLETGERFEPEIVEDWYKARKYVLDSLADMAFAPDSKKRLHAVVESDTPQMLAVVRHIALYSHFLNHDEEGSPIDSRCRTVITVRSDRPDIRQLLEKEEYLCNLPKYCRFVDAEGKDIDGNRDSYIDIEIRIVRNADLTDDLKAGRNEDEVVRIFSDDGLQECCRSAEEKGEDIYGIDTSKAFYTNAMYELGADVDNLPDEDIHCASRYALALSTFQNEKLRKVPLPLISTDKTYGILDIREKLSNVFCSDCFEMRARAIEGNAAEEKKSKRKDILKLWEQNNESLSRCEHRRWVVEKLIMGYSPLNAEQRYRDESLFFNGGARKQYRKELKRNACCPAHIDICSYRELRRIHPEVLKHDSILMLGIPRILDKIRSDSGK